MNETQLDPNSRHYDAGGIEVIEIIKAKLTDEQYKGYCLGNVIKYSNRANFKGNFDRDIEKAGYYIKFLQDIEESEKKLRDTYNPTPTSAPIDWISRNYGGNK